MKKLVYGVLVAAALAQVSACTSAGIGGSSTDSSVKLDRRTAGAVIGDQEIEFRARNRLREAFPKIGISATSYNRQLLLTGQVPDEATRARATEVVTGIAEMRTLHNELTVSGTTSLFSTANDASITSQVKARLMRDERVPGTKVKVVTEAGAVYLMGLMKRSEAEVAKQIASTTSGVTRVVALFEYLD